MRPRPSAGRPNAYDQRISPKSHHRLDLAVLPLQVCAISDGSNRHTLKHAGP